MSAWLEYHRQNYLMTSSPNSFPVSLPLSHFLSGKHGFIIAVTTIDNIGAGMIQHARGFVVYPVKYKAIVFRPFKNEVLDAVVKQVRRWWHSCVHPYLFVHTNLLLGCPENACNTSHYTTRLARDLLV